MTSRPVVSVY
jgi:large subunit ribosomal protein L4e